MPIRILIADDNPAVRTALRQLLSGEGRQIVEAEDGADAVSKALESPPDIAILDLAMPALDGLSVARELSQKLPNVLLVMCTMHWTQQLQREALKFGVSKVISKAHGGLLVSTVDELLASRRPPDITALPLPPVLLPEALPSTSVIDSAKEETPAVTDVPSKIPPSEIS